MINYLCIVHGFITCTHDRIWCLHKMATVLQTTSLDAFSWLKIWIWFKFHKGFPDRTSGVDICNVGNLVVALWSLDLCPSSLILHVLSFDKLQIMIFWICMGKFHMTCHWQKCAMVVLYQLPFVILYIQDMKLTISVPANVLAPNSAHYKSRHDFFFKFL